MMADAGDTAGEAAADRDLWARANREYADDHADRAWAAADITWGNFNVPALFRPGHPRFCKLSGNVGQTRRVAVDG
jgi:hypothetical protein